MAREPLLTYFSETEVAVILDESFKVLETTGVYTPHPGASQLFLEAGARIDPEEQARILIPREIVKDALDNITNRFKLYTQDKASFLQVEIGNTYYGPGSDLQFTIDLETGKRRRTTVADIAANIRLIDSLPQFDFLMSTGLPGELAESEELYAETFGLMVRNSNKPIIATATNLSDIKKIHEVAVKVAGSEEEFYQNPFFLAYLEPISPLKIEPDIADRIMFCAEKGIPMVFAAGANLGIEGPGRPEDVIIQGCAESLSGLTLAYLVNPEVKFVFGANSAGFDEDKGIVSYGGPEWFKTQAYYAEIARRLNLPTWAAAGCSDSNLLDAQAGLEYGMSALMAELSACTLVHDVGYLSHGDVTDPRAYVLGAEIIKRVRWFATRGIVVPDIAAKVIDDVARGRIKTFLESEHTFGYRETRYHPMKWIDRKNLKDRSSTLDRRLASEVKRLLRNKKLRIDTPIKAKRKPKRKAAVKVLEADVKVPTLQEIFKASPNAPQVVIDYLKGRLKAKEDGQKLYIELVDALLASIKDADLVFQLAYGRLFDQTSAELLKHVEFEAEKGTPFVLGTVEGDVHYVGKSLVAQLVNSFGYKAQDAGVDVSTGRLIHHLLDTDSYLLGLSALLTTTKPKMKKTIDALKELGLKDQVGVIIGGAVVNKSDTGKFGADLYERSASDAAPALNTIKEQYKEQFEKKRIKGMDFTIIGEHLNSISERVRKAMVEKDKKTILAIKRKQFHDGARYLDLAVSHVGSLEEQIKTIEWLVPALQKRPHLPLSFDSDDYRVIEAGLKVHKPQAQRAIVNSATLEKERLDNMLRLAADYNTSIVFLASEGKTAEDKVKLVEQFLEEAEKHKIYPGRIFVDPGLETMAATPDSPSKVLQTISLLKEKHPGLHYLLGLTNIGFGLTDKLSKTTALQQAFLSLAMRVGLDYAIGASDILKKELVDSEEARSGSIEFMAGIMDGVEYARRTESEAYDEVA